VPVDPRVDVAVPNCFPYVPHLEPYPHHRGLLDVIGLGEGRPSAAGTDVPDNGLDPAVNMVSIWGERAVPPVKAAIYVDPATDASAPIWAAATVGGMARPPRGCPLHHLLSRCLPRQLELIISVAVG
jgi:hypothetical protein